MKTTDLTPREGKILRFVCTSSRPQGVLPEMCIQNSTPGFPTNLPQNSTQARLALEVLRKHKLIKRTSDGYLPLPAGVKVMKAANKQGIWQSMLD